MCEIVLPTRFFFCLTVQRAPFFREKWFSMSFNYAEGCANLCNLIFLRTFYPHLASASRTFLFCWFSKAARKKRKNFEAKLETPQSEAGERPARGFSLAIALFGPAERDFSEAESAEILKAAALPNKLSLENISQRKKLMNIQCVTQRFLLSIFLFISLSSSYFFRRGHLAERHSALELRSCSNWGSLPSVDAIDAEQNVVSWNESHIIKPSSTQSVKSSSCSVTGLRRVDDLCYSQ